MKNIILLLLSTSLLFSSCAVFKRNRVNENNGIEKDDFQLPVFLYPSKIKNTKRLLIFLSGDGGWLKFEDAIATKFAENGFVTLGFNSRNYFWKSKTPKETADDINALIKKYCFKYRLNKVYISGYSFGADIVPFIYNLLDPRVKSRVVALQMLSPFRTTDFEIHLTDLINTSTDNYKYRVDEQVMDISIPIYCFYGIDETIKPLNTIELKNFKISTVKGNHHYHEADFIKIINSIKLNFK